MRRRGPFVVVHFLECGVFRFLKFMSDLKVVELTAFYVTIRYSSRSGCCEPGPNITEILLGDTDAHAALKLVFST